MEHPLARGKVGWEGAVGEKAPNADEGVWVAVGPRVGVGVGLVKWGGEALGRGRGKDAIVVMQ